MSPVTASRTTAAVRPTPEEPLPVVYTPRGDTDDTYLRGGSGGGGVSGGGNGEGLSRGSVTTGRVGVQGAACGGGARSGARIFGEGPHFGEGPQEVLGVEDGRQGVG